MENEDELHEKYKSLRDEMDKGAVYIDTHKWKIGSMEDKFNGGMDMASLYEALASIDPDLREPANWVNNVADTLLDTQTSLDSKACTIEAPEGTLISAAKNKDSSIGSIDVWIQNLLIDSEADHDIGPDCFDVGMISVSDNVRLRSVLFEGKGLVKLTPTVIPNLSVIALLSKLRDKMYDSISFEPNSYEFHLNFRLIENLIEFYRMYDYKMKRDTMIYFNKLWKQYK
jgi:hypothetical protein